MPHHTCSVVAYCSISKRVTTFTNITKPLHSHVVKNVKKIETDSLAIIILLGQNHDKQMNGLVMQRPMDNTKGLTVEQRNNEKNITFSCIKNKSIVDLNI